MENVTEDTGDIRVYTLSGQLVLTLRDTSPDEAGRQLQNRLGDGVYILRSEKEACKLIIGGR